MSAGGAGSAAKAERAEHEAMLALAVGAARAAGVLLLGMRERALATVTTKATATDMVSEADRAAERLIVERLLAIRPDDAVLGEEGGTHFDRTGVGTSGVRWVIDPLDGTTNYLYGLPAFVVSIGAELDGVGIIGVVYDPTHDELFTAIAGGGAQLNGRPIAVSGHTDLATALVGTGFAYEEERRRAEGLVVARVVPRVRDIRRSGAAALDLCNVACGRYDAFYERGLKPWDMAAGDVIVREAGGVMSAIDGGPAVAGSVLAATPAIVEPLRALLLGEA